MSKRWGQACGAWHPLVLDVFSEYVRFFDKVVSRRIVFLVESTVLSRFAGIWLVVLLGSSLSGLPRWVHLVSEHGEESPHRHVHIDGGGHDHHEKPAESDDPDGDNAGCALCAVLAGFHLAPQDVAGGIHFGEGPIAAIGVQGAAPHVSDVGRLSMPRGPPALILS